MFAHANQLCFPAIDVQRGLYTVTGSRCEVFAAGLARVCFRDVFVVGQGETSKGSGSFSYYVFFEGFIVEGGFTVHIRLTCAASGGLHDLQARVGGCCFFLRVGM